MTRICEASKFTLRTTTLETESEKVGGDLDDGTNSIYEASYPSLTNLCELMLSCSKRILKDDIEGIA